MINLKLIGSHDIKLGILTLEIIFYVNPENQDSAMIQIVNIVKCQSEKRERCKGR